MNKAGREKGSKKGKEKEDQAAPREKSALRAQTAFSESIEAINTDLMSSEVRLDSFPLPSPEALESQLENLYPGKAMREFSRSKDSVAVPRSGCCSGGWCGAGCGYQYQGFREVPRNHIYESDLELSVHGSGAGARARLLGVQDGDVTLDNGFSSISADDYLKFRLNPLIQTYSRESPKLVMQFKYLYLLIFFTAALSSVLTLVGQELWIPLVVGASAGCSSVMEFGNLQTRVLNTNKALLALRNLLIWWEGLSMVQKRLPQNKAILVEAAEAAAEAEQGIAMSFKVKKAESSDDADGDEADNAPEKK